jgi:peptidyl-prolyl cis-trans isomerase B (cyclophilin B)
MREVVSKRGGRSSAALAAIVAALSLAVIMLFAGCGQNAPDSNTGNEEETGVTETETNAETNATEAKPVVEITMEGGGKIEIELDPSAAPLTVENFLKLVNEGFYDGLTFHRIIPGFMIQGGDPEGTGMGGSDATVKGEFSSNGVDNTISHTRGIISMARSQAPDSASSQFFITNADSVFLDGDYAAFGRVISGMEEVDRISGVETDASDAPTSPVVIESIKVKQ